MIPYLPDGELLHIYLTLGRYTVLVSMWSRTRRHKSYERYESIGIIHQFWLTLLFSLQFDSVHHGSDNSGSLLNCGQNSPFSVEAFKYGLFKGIYIKDILKNRNFHRNH